MLYLMTLELLLKAIDVGERCVPLKTPLVCVCVCVCVANKVIRVDTEYIRVIRIMIEWQREKICTHAQIQIV